MQYFVNAHESSLQNNKNSESMHCVAGIVKNFTRGVKPIQLIKISSLNLFSCQFRP